MVVLYLATIRFFESGTAKVALKNAVSDDVLKKAVEDQDYKVIEIK